MAGSMLAQERSGRTGMEALRKVVKHYTPFSDENAIKRYEARERARLEALREFEKPKTLVETRITVEKVETRQMSRLVGMLIDISRRIWSRIPGTFQNYLRRERLRVKAEQATKETEARVVERTGMSRVIWKLASYIPFTYPHRYEREIKRETARLIAEAEAREVKAAENVTGSNTPCQRD